MALHLRGPTQTTAYSTHKSVILLKSGHINGECARCIQIPHFGIDIIMRFFYICIYISVAREKRKGEEVVCSEGEKYYFENKKYS